MNNSRNTLLCIIAIAIAVVLSSCSHRVHKAGMMNTDSLQYTEKQIDSIHFSKTHHYGQNFNFIVKADSLVLIKGQPEEYLGGLSTDTACMRKGDRVAVADIKIMTSDPIDSVWVELARDQYSFGWARESTILPHVVPDDPISKFISMFSDTHLLITLIIISVIAFAYLLRKLFASNAKIVLYNDISSFYPTALIIIVSASACFYSSMQLFAPDEWQNFYFHPTLNPFSVSPLLAVFLASVWLMLIVTVAVIDEARRLLPASEALLYLCSLCGICAMCYILFSITTLYYVGYPLLVVAIVFVVRKYLKKYYKPFVCGNCGARMNSKGKCPECGAMNE